MNIINKKKKKTFHHHNNGNNSSNNMKIDEVEKAYTSFFRAIRNGQIEIVKTNCRLMLTILIYLL